MEDITGSQFSSSPWVLISEVILTPFIRVGKNSISELETSEIEGMAFQLPNSVIKTGDTLIN